MSHYLFTSEAVAAGHPDKIADQISDAILDACLSQDPESRVACETMVSSGLVVLAGEISSKAEVDYAKVARDTIKKIGYCDCELGFDYRSCGIISTINKQSPDIAQGVDDSKSKELGAGDQGIMFGYACTETPELMPLPITLSHKIVNELRKLRESGELSYLRPDAKSQVTIEYNENNEPIHLHTVVISTQHNTAVKQETLVHDLKALVKRLVPEGFIDDNTLFYINPTGRFVLGGPVADCGLTGRKIIVDTYGGMGHHGGGAFSGKDPTKVDRSGSYAARYVAKNIVAAKLATRCEVQVSFAIGVSYPISIKVNTFGTGTVSEELLAHVIPQVFNLTPKGIIDMLDLKRPIYSQTATGGHFGREEENFTWEKTDRVEDLIQAVKQASFAIDR
ncbi:MAG: methionine adenosyltransferase [Chlamydiota bacterium]|nr:methionine adenosyltransferase [Chlamydiota bacterium]